MFGIIVNFVLPYIGSSLLYWAFMILVNVKLYISGYERIVFQDCTLYWHCYFPIAQLKQSWKCWHSSIVAPLWNTLFGADHNLIKLSERSICCLVLTGPHKTRAPVQPWPLSQVHDSSSIGESGAHFVERACNLD